MQIVELVYALGWMFLGLLLGIIFISLLIGGKRK